MNTVIVTVDQKVQTRLKLGTDVQSIDTLTYRQTKELWTIPPDGLIQRYKSYVVVSNYICGYIRLWKLHTCEVMLSLLLCHPVVILKQMNKWQEYAVWTWTWNAGAIFKHVSVLNWPLWHRFTDKWWITSNWCKHLLLIQKRLKVLTRKGIVFFLLFQPVLFRETEQEKLSQGPNTNNVL